jgi:hypothetical protein
MPIKIITHFSFGFDILPLNSQYIKTLGLGTIPLLLTFFLPLYFAHMTEKKTQYSIHRIPDGASVQALSEIAACKHASSPKVPLLHLPGFLVHRIKKLMKYTDN